MAIKRKHRCRITDTYFRFHKCYRGKEISAFAITRETIETMACYTDILIFHLTVVLLGTNHQIFGEGGDQKL